MVKKTFPSPDFKWTEKIWQAAEGLVSPKAAEREKALDYLIDLGALVKSPLIAYLLATRLSDPDLEVRYHVVQALGSVLPGNERGIEMLDPILMQLQSYLAYINTDQVLDLLEVSEQYLSAEENLIKIFKLSSYAGNRLSGIVNDRKKPLEIRQKAIFFCGEIGYLETSTTLKILVSRIEKRNQLLTRSPFRKKELDENQLYPYAVAALEKLSIGSAAKRESSL
ncbi:MAG: hypothetical protein MUO54_11695 [Anaerolineales bacterium]|nr:hypothetical protein [Anaerolineales bacterium]